jgi:methylaspartate ammonia-lyase
MEADNDIIDMSLKIGYQQEKIDLLESIIKTLTNRGYSIKTAVDWARFMMGG